MYIKRSESVLIFGHDTWLFKHLFKRDFRGLPLKLKGYITEGGDCILHWMIAGFGLIAGIVLTLGLLGKISPFRSVIGIVICVVMIVIARREFTWTARRYSSRRQRRK